MLHDDASPHPEALLALLAGAADDPDADVLGPMLREWPSLKRLLELGVTISGTGRRETGLERGEYDQGQYSELRPVLAVNTAGHAGAPPGPRRARRVRRRAADLRQRPRLRLAGRRRRPPHGRGAAGGRLPRRGRPPRAAAYAADRPAHPLPGAARRAVHPARQRPPARAAAAGRPAGARHASSGCSASWLVRSPGRGARRPRGATSRSLRIPRRPAGRPAGPAGSGRPPTPRPSGALLRAVVAALPARARLPSATWRPR